MCHICRDAFVCCDYESAGFALLKIIGYYAEEEAEPSREPAARPAGNEPLENVRSRVVAVMKEADNELKGLMERTWCLGPHHSGPNILLAAKADAQSSLFSVPEAHLVHLGKKAGRYPLISSVPHEVVYRMSLLFIEAEHFRTDTRIYCAAEKH